MPTITTRQSVMANTSPRHMPLIGKVHPIKIERFYIYLAPIGGGRGIVMPMSVCLFVCLFVCVFVCVFVCPCFRKISMCNISAISQPIIMKLGIHITYGYTVTDKYFQNFRSKVKVVGRRKVKNVIWPYLGNEWS